MLYVVVFISWLIVLSLGPTVISAHQLCANSRLQLSPTCNDLKLLPECRLYLYSVTVRMAAFAVLVGTFILKCISQRCMSV